MFPVSVVSSQPDVGYLLVSCRASVQPARALPGEKVGCSSGTGPQEPGAGLCKRAAT